MKLQYTLKESPEQPWFGSIQYSPVENTQTKKMYRLNKLIWDLIMEMGIKDQGKDLYIKKAYVRRSLVLCTNNNTDVSTGIVFLFFFFFKVIARNDI